MDSDDEVMHVLVEKETNTYTDEEEHFMTLRSSSTRRKKSEPKQRVEGYAMLYTDYFTK
jgi:hypothetical protein